MAHPNLRTMTAPEVAFICEMELITVIPRQKLPSIELMGGKTPPLNPPQRADIPLWLALLLARQQRADIVAPPWLSVPALTSALERETSERQTKTFSAAPPLPNTVRNPFPHEETFDGDTRHQATPPFVHTCIASGHINRNPDLGLPYHAFSIAHILLNAASENIPEAEHVRRLVRDLEEVRAAKLRGHIEELNSGAGLQLNGIGSLEISGSRSLITSVVDRLRALGSSREAMSREDAAGGSGRAGGGIDGDDDDNDEVML